MASTRTALVADTAIALLAERGMRGLTHRAVDEAAGLPPGTTSNHARTRAALLELALARLTEREAGAFAGVPGAEPPSDLDAAAATMAGVLHWQLTEGRVTTLARYELALEATRRPELRERYDQAGALFRGPAVAALTRAGSPEPERHARQLVAFCEGVVFDAIAGAGAVPGEAEILAGLRDLMRGMLAGRA
jgi:DNA-binding transcriptional regulator YbjK